MSTGNTDNNVDYIYKDLSYKVIGCVYEVHSELGLVHKEIIYHRALAVEFKNQKISFTHINACIFTPNKFCLQNKDLLLKYHKFLFSQNLLYYLHN